MAKRAICATALLIGVVAAAATAALAGPTKPITVRAGNVIMTLNGNASPTRLPKRKLAPVSFWASGKISTADGTHPPALREVILDVGKAGTIEAAAFPSCRLGQLVATTTTQAERKCSDAIVGRGKTGVEVAFPEQAPFSAKGPLVLFNGGERGGKALLLIHAYVSVPAPTAIVTSVITTREDKGPYRLHSITRIPAIAGGAGSVREFALEINRMGYLTANCSNGHFSAHIDAAFADGTTVSGAFQRPCQAIP